MQHRTMKTESRIFTRDYTLLLQGSLFSTLGYLLYSAAVSYWAYEKTGSTGVMGVTASVSLIMNMLLSPIAGSVADHTSRRNIIAGCDAVCGVVFSSVGILAVKGLLSVPVVIGAAVVSGLCSSFLQPASSSLVMDILKPEVLIRGQSISRGLNSLINVIGAAVSGSLIVICGAPLLILINGICYFVSALTEIFITDYPSHANEKRPSISNTLAGLADGARFILKTKSFVILMSLSLSVNLFCSGAYSLLVAFVLDNGMTTQQYGYLSAAMSVGALFGVAFIGAVNLKKGLHFKLMTASFFAFIALYAMAFYFARFYLTAVCLFAGDFFNGVLNALLGAIIALLIPADKRGVVFGFIMAASFGGNALSALLYGLAAEYMPLRIVAVIGHSICFIPAFAAAFSKDLRSEIDGLDLSKE